MMDHVAQNIGYCIIAASGALVTAAILWCAAYLLNKAGWRAYDRAKSLYKIECIEYWFSRMGKDGTHAVRKDYEENMKERVK